ncbi:MAG TPA: trypsin-like peptidase domain-containing protein, partial [Pedobacter sp.]|nr:trypsin-like peptidase domain-containing protein [Pedobacter sp.]
MKKYAFAFAWLVLLFFAADVHSQTFDRKNIEATVGLAVKKAYATSVRIWGFDSVTKQQASAQFSGVVVTEEGHILTVAHAAVPGRTYKIFFTDGKEYLALGLGRIGFADKQNMPDVAVLKIIEKGKWPYAEMGWSSSLKVNEPCVSIAYPETL